MKKFYISPNFEFLEIKFSDPICGSAEFPAESGNPGDGWEDLDDKG